jgi:hypothetical protein
MTLPPVAAMKAPAGAADCNRLSSLCLYMTPTASLSFGIMLSSAVIDGAVADAGGDAAARPGIVQVKAIMQLLTGPYCDNTLLPDGSVGNERPTALSEQECIDSYGSCQVANEAATQEPKSVCDTAGGVFTSAASYTGITDGEGNPLSDMQKYEMLSYMPPTSLPPTMITMMEQMMPDAVDEDSDSPTYGANLRGGATVPFCAVIFGPYNHTSYEREWVEEE